MESFGTSGARLSGCLVMGWDSGLSRSLLSDAGSASVDDGLTPRPPAGRSSVGSLLVQNIKKAERPQCGVSTGITVVVCSEKGSRVSNLSRFQ